MRLSSNFSWRTAPCTLSLPAHAVQGRLLAGLGKDKDAKAAFESAVDIARPLRAHFPVILGLVLREMAKYTRNTTEADRARREAHSIVEVLPMTAEEFATLVL